MAVRVAINGFGRTGRAAFRAAIESDADIEWVAVNDVVDPPMLAQLLKYDTVYGSFDGTVEAADGAIVVNGVRIETPMEPPGGAPVGRPRCRCRDRVERTLPRPRGCRQAPAGRSEEGDRLAPAKDPDVTVALGVNFETYDPDVHNIISNASCTTNCLAPVAKVLHEALGFRHGVMTTVHAYTGDQQLLDGPHKDYRRARAAAANLVPTSDPGHLGRHLLHPDVDHAESGLRTMSGTVTFLITNAGTIDPRDGGAQDRPARGQLSRSTGFEGEPNRFNEDAKGLTNVGETGGTPR